jgi:hypothetical protein
VILLASSILAYRPFLDPMPVWDYWYLLILPLCTASMVVYKSMKCHSMKQVPREAAVNVLWIIGLFALAAVLLMGLVKWLEKS